MSANGKIRELELQRNQALTRAADLAGKLEDTLTELVEMKKLRAELHAERDALQAKLDELTPQAPVKANGKAAETRATA